jgi:hypothetical protein
MNFKPGLGPCDFGSLPHRLGNAPIQSLGKLEGEIGGSTLDVMEEDGVFPSAVIYGEGWAEDLYPAGA